jgi:hypothetical protein
MSDEVKSRDVQASTSATRAEKKDSFGVPVEKSPWLIYALLQIPIVLIMILIVYFMYQQREGG